MEIKPGDTVEYIDTVTVKHGNKVSKSKVTKQGIWTGTKVILNDRERTTVYKLEWLTRVETALSVFHWTENTWDSIKLVKIYHNYVDLDKIIEIVKNK